MLVPILQALTKQLHGHEREDGYACEQEHYDVEDVWEAVANVPHSRPDLSGLRKVDDKKGSDWPRPPDGSGCVVFPP